MEIDIAGLIAEARHGMAAAGLVPEECCRAPTPTGRSGIDFAAALGELAATHKIEIPLDKPRADIVCVLFLVDLQKYPKSVVAIASHKSSAAVMDVFLSGAGCRQPRFRFRPA